MKKKLLLGAVVVAGLTMGLTSCVDNVESASVTNIRNAKTEQLKSLAALNNANAQAALILANAEAAAQAANQAYLEAQAALLAAQADYEAAQAELIRAQAALLDAQTEAERAKLEYELKLLQAELDKKAQELAAAEAEADAKAKLLEAELKGIEIALQLAQLELDKQTWIFQQMIETAQKDAQNAEEEAAKKAAYEAARKLRRLLSAYEEASTTLATTKGQLALDQMQLLKAQSGLQDTKQGAEEAIVNARNAIKAAEDEIAHQESIIAYWQKWGGKTITVDDVITARDEYLAALEAEEPLWDEYAAADKVFDEASSALYYSDYVVSVDDILSRYYGYEDVYSWEDPFQYGYDQPVYDRYQVYNKKLDVTEFYKFRVCFISKGNNSYPSECFDKYCLEVWQADYDYNNYDKIKSWTLISAVPVFEKVNYDGETGQYTSYFNLVDGGAGLDAWNEQMLNRLEYYQWSPNIEDLEKALADAKTAQTKAAGELTTAETNLKKAKDAVDAAVTEYNEKQDALTAAQDAYANYPLPDPDDEGYEAAVAEQAKLEQAVTAAQTAFNAANTKLNNAYDDLYGNGVKEGATQVYNKAQAALWNANWNVVLCTNDLNYAQNSDVDNTSVIDKQNQFVADIKAAAPDVDPAIDAYNSTKEERAAKYDAWDEANDATIEARNKYNNFFSAIYYVWPFTGTAVVGGDNEADTAIAKAQAVINQCNTDISNNNNTIANSQKLLDEIEAGIYGNGNNEYNASGQVLILILENKIAADQVAVDNAQMRFDIAKAALEAELNK